jgi:hypothetical protein
MKHFTFTLPRDYPYEGIIKRAILSFAKSSNSEIDSTELASIENLEERKNKTIKLPKSGMKFTVRFRN